MIDSSGPRVRTQDERRAEARRIAVLRQVRNRDLALRQALEAELEQGWPPPFDWAAWRRTRATVIAQLEAAREWDRPRLRLVHGLIPGPQTAQRAA